MRATVLRAAQPAISFGFDTTKSLVCEPGSALKLPMMLTERLAARRCMVVTDKPLRDLGLLDETLAALKTAGVDTVVYDNVVADPPESVVNEAVDFAKDAGVDCVVGFGGGSPMDVAKLVAYLAGPTDQKLSDIWGVGACATPTRLPLIQVPTTAGTGSEVTPISIVTTGATTKMGVVSPILLPDIAILDAALTTGLPASTTAATGVDAMVHATEAYTSKNRKNPLSDALSREALSLLSKNIHTAVHDPTNIDARQNMLLGSMMAGMSFANAPVAAVHALAYPIGGHYKVPHGMSCSLMFSTVMRFNSEKSPAAAKLYAEIAPIVFPHLDASGMDEELAFAMVDGLNQLAIELEMPTTLKDVGIPSDAVDMMASDAMLQTRLLVNNPVEVTEADAAVLYRQIGGWA